MSSAYTQPVPLMRRGFQAVALADAANLMLLILLKAFVRPNPAFLPLTPVWVVLFTTLFTAAAVGVYALLAARMKHPNRAFTLIALAALALSIVPSLVWALNPLSAPFPARPADYLSLIVLHLAAAGIVLRVVPEKPGSTADKSR